MMLAAWGIFVVLVHMLRTALAKPAPEPRPRCPDCEDRRFLDARGLDMHRRAAHLETFDDRQPVPAEYRQEGT